MGLSDIYYQRPYVPADDTQQKLTQGFAQVGELPMRQAQLESQQLANQGQAQQNANAAYTAPGAPASEHRALIGRYVREHLMAGPPEFQQRLMQELSQGGLQAQPSPPGNMVEQVPQNMGPQQYQSYQPGNYTGQEPTETRDVQVPSMPAPDIRIAQKSSTMTRQPLPAAQAFAAARNAPQQAQPAQSAPMTNYDVESYMRAAPLIKQDGKAAALEEKRREFDAMMDYRGRALALKERLAKLAADAKLATNDNDRKRALELLRIQVDQEKAGIAAKARIMGGLYGIIDSEGTQAYLQYLDSFVKEAEQGVQGAENQPAIQPIQTMAPKPQGKPTPRPIGKPSAPSNETGKTITIVNKKTGQTKKVTQMQYDSSPYKADWDVVR